MLLNFREEIARMKMCFSKVLPMFKSLNISYPMVVFPVVSVQKMVFFEKGKFIIDLYFRCKVRYFFILTLK